MSEEQTTEQTTENIPVAIMVMPQAHGGVDVSTTVEMSIHEMLLFLELAKVKLAVALLGQAMRAEEEAKNQFTTKRKVWTPYD